MGTRKMRIDARWERDMVRSDSRAVCSRASWLAMTFAKWQGHSVRVYTSGEGIMIAAVFLGSCLTHPRKRRQEVVLPRLNFEVVMSLAGKRGGKLMRCQKWRYCGRCEGGRSKNVSVHIVYCVLRHRHDSNMRPRRELISSQSP